VCNFKLLHGQDLVLLCCHLFLEFIKFTITGPKAGEYLTHRVVPGRGTGAELADITYEVLAEYESLETLQVYGARPFPPNLLN
jgi:hypothetical protein